MHSAAPSQAYLEKEKWHLAWKIVGRMEQKKRGHTIRNIGSMKRLLGDEPDESWSCQVLVLGTAEYFLGVLGGCVDKNDAARHGFEYRTQLHRQI